VERLPHRDPSDYDRRVILARALPLVLACALAAPALGAKGRAEKPKERAKLVVLDLVGDAVSENVRRSLSGKVAVRFSQDDRLDVLSGDDVRGMAALEAEKQAAGCDDSCLAELAGALDARLVVSGFVGRLGSLYVVNLSLFDAQAARSITRATIEAERVEDLGDKVDAAVDGMRADIPLAHPRSGPPVLAMALTISGGVAGAVGVVLAGVGLALFAGQQSARGELNSAASDFEPGDESSADALADANAKYDDARGTYATIGLPLVATGAVLGAAGVTCAIVGGVLWANAGGAE
jgi:hypothetical protein